MKHITKQWSLFIMEELSWQKLCNWLRKQSDEKIDEIGDDPSACWVGSEYVIRTLNPEFIDHIDYNKIISISELEKLTSWVHIYCENNYEIHYFSLFIDESDDSVVIVQTYGGIKGLHKIRMNWKEWLTFAYDVETHETGKSWRKIFGIPLRYNIPNKLGKTTFYLLCSIPKLSV